MAAEMDVMVCIHVICSWCVWVCSVPGEMGNTLDYVIEMQS